MINCVYIIWKLIREAIIICLIQHFEADFLWKVSLKILDSGIVLKTFTHAIHAVFFAAAAGVMWIGQSRPEKAKLFTKINSRLHSKSKRVNWLWFQMREIIIKGHKTYKLKRKINVCGLQVLKMNLWFPKIYLKMPITLLLATNEQERVEE